ncbi:hypothetical protein M9458_029540, partial [Cirrhinus mrigala]
MQSAVVRGRPSSQFRRVSGVDTGEKPILISHLFHGEFCSATPDPEPSQSPPRPAEYQPEPTDDGELKPAATSEPSQLITTEPELHKPPDQVREPATMTATVDVSVEREIAEYSITHYTTAE